MCSSIPGSPAALQILRLEGRGALKLTVKFTSSQLHFKIRMFFLAKEHYIEEQRFLSWGFVWEQSVLTGLRLKHRLPIGFDSSNGK
jgi:hypothetical protein